MESEKITEKVEEVLEPSFKSGEKNGRKWNLATVLTDTGKKVRVFGWPKVGDELELTYSEQYKNYSGSVKQENIREVLGRLEAGQVRIEDKLTKLIGE